MARIRKLKYPQYGMNTFRIKKLNISVGKRLQRQTGNAQKKKKGPTDRQKYSYSLVLKKCKSKQWATIF